MNTVTTEPNWDEAPEGATHWESAQLCASGWLMKEKDAWSYWSKSDGTWRYMGPPSDERMHFIYPLHTPWTGAGLPPVGAVCEVLNPELSRAEWEKCTVLYVGKHRILYDSESCSERIGYVDNLQFRPIRTPEQIAEEERNAAVTEIAKTLRSWIPDSVDSMFAAKAIWEAGYRKAGEA